MSMGLIALVAAQEGRPPYAILRHSHGQLPEGSYAFNYETENGIKAGEQASATLYTNGQMVLNARGSYSYIAPDGRPISVEYVADENGFRAVGDHLPTPPPTPEAILKSLEFNRAHPEEHNQF